MRSASKLAVAAAVILGFGLVIAGALAHSGEIGPRMMMHGMAGPMDASSGPMAGPMMQHGDAAFAADMQLVHRMLQNNDKIRRTVTNLPDGIRTVTDSDDAEVAQSIQAHVASMEKRLGEGRVFNLFSPTLPLLFERKDRIKTLVETTEKGVVVTQTSTDAAVVAALQAHAIEVSELARDGMAAMVRNMQARMMRHTAQR